MRHGLDPFAREQLLRSTLVFATMQSSDPEQQASFWSGGFSQLLGTPTVESEAHWARGADSGVPDGKHLPVKRLRGWLKIVEKSTQWPLEVQMLSDLLKCRAQADVIGCLWESHRHLLCESGHERKINSDVITGI